MLNKRFRRSRWLCFGVGESVLWSGVRLAMQMECQGGAEIERHRDEKPNLALRAQYKTKAPMNTLARSLDMIGDDGPTASR